MLMNFVLLKRLHKAAQFISFQGLTGKRLLIQSGLQPIAKIIAGHLALRYS
jgi:hypothetical protein